MSGEPKRYSPAGSAVMQEMHGGRYVKSEDYDALCAELEKFRGGLTADELREAAGLWERMEDDGSDYGNVDDWDTAIMAVRTARKVKK